MEFAWNKKIRAYKMDAERGRIVDEFVIKDILIEPNRYQIEAIIQAACLTMRQLVELEEQRAERLGMLTKGINLNGRPSDTSGSNSSAQPTSQQ